MEFDELLEHLADLIALADNEGFQLLGVALLGVYARANNRRGTYAERRDPRDAADVPTLSSPIDPRD